MSIGKSLRNVASRLSGKTSKSTRSEDAVVDYSGLYDVWPDGTWDLKWGNSSMKDMDMAVQGMLLDAYTVEQRWEIEESLGRALNPGMFGADPIPMGWKPRPKTIKHVFGGATRDPRVEPYVLGKLRARGRLGS